MYTKEHDADHTYGGGWMILDPDGDWIASTPTQGQADALLSHLNRYYPATCSCRSVS